MERATAAKTAVEERERELRRVREESGQVHVQRFFAQNKEGRWIPKFTYVSRPARLCLFRRKHQYSPSPCRIPSDPAQAEIAVQNWIWSPPKPSS